MTHHKQKLFSKTEVLLVWEASVSTHGCHCTGPAYTEHREKCDFLEIGQWSRCACTQNTPAIQGRLNRLEVLVHIDALMLDLPFGETYIDAYYVSGAFRSTENVRNRFGELRAGEAFADTKQQLFALAEGEVLLVCDHVLRDGVRTNRLVAVSMYKTSVSVRYPRPREVAAFKREQAELQKLRTNAQAFT